MLDVLMASPKENIPAHGSSCSAGGVFRGHAQGNTFNMADANDIWNDMNIYADDPLEKPEKGKIHFYISDLNPSEIDMAQPSFTATIHNINKFQSFQNVIAHGSHDYSPIRRKLYIFINNNQFNKYIQVLHIVSLYVKTIVGVSRDAMKQL